MEASEIHARRPNAKDVITPKNGEHFIFPIGDVTVRSEELSVDTRGSSDTSQPKQKMTEKPATIFGRSKGITYCHHTEPRVQLYVPKEETFLIPLKCIVMTRTTHTNLDVFQESRIEDGLAFFIPSAVLFQLQSLRWFFCNSELFFFQLSCFLPTDGEGNLDALHTRFLPHCAKTFRDQAVFFIVTLKLPSSAIKNALTTGRSIE